MTTSFETITLDLTPPFAYLTLNRPHAKNAMSMQMVLDLLAAFEALRDNRAVRAVLLSGVGDTFCAGGDIKEMAAAFQSGEPQANRGLLDTLLRAVNQAPQVIIAKVQGAAMGGGFGLLCVSDIAIADSSATFGMPEVRLGLAPALISPFVIARIGLTTARRLMLTGTRFGAEKALEYGLIHEACAPEALDARVQAALDEVRQCSPNAIAAIKKLMFEVTTKTLDETVDYRANLLDTLRRSDDGMEGMMAFVEKRPAKWAK
ncbi:MAG: enoyl-CoA hydratase-related protein [Anaerolineae bacterium]